MLNLTSQMTRKKSYLQVNTSCQQRQTTSLVKLSCKSLMGQSRLIDQTLAYRMQVVNLVQQKTTQTVVFKL